MDNQLFYIIAPEKLEFPLHELSLQERRERLAELIEANGAQWASVRMRKPDFMAVLEKLDGYMRANDEFVNSAFENSPGQVLPIGSTDSYDPLLGYYEPDRVREYYPKLRTIPAAVIDSWENGDFADQVAYAFRSTFAEAMSRRHAVALEHR